MMFGISAKIIVILLILNSSSSINILTGQDNILYKFYVLAKFVTIKDVPDHPLNLFNYKNIIFSSEQLLLTLSADPQSPVPDKTYNTSSYLLTATFKYLDLPCLNKSYICTHKQFKKSYEVTYPEIDFDIPQEILTQFKSEEFASDHCLLQIYGSINDKIWVCHENYEVLFNFQDQLSAVIRNKIEIDYKFTADYILDNRKRIFGIAEIGKDGFRFYAKEGNQMILFTPFDDIVPYAISLFLKEELNWTGKPTEKPESERCFKFEVRSKKAANYFCIFTERNDREQSSLINVFNAKYKADQYSNKINNRIQSQALSSSLNEMRKFSEAIDPNDPILNPIKQQVRIEYYVIRHKMLNMIKLDKLSTERFKTELEKAKDTVIARVCSGGELCRKTMKMLVDNGTLDLNARNRFAYDTQNPYNAAINKNSPLFRKSKYNPLVKRLEMFMSKLNQPKQRDYIKDPIEKSETFEIPNRLELSQAFNTLSLLRDITNTFNNIEELGKNCRLNVKFNSYNLRRKVALLQFVGEQDTFFEYFRSIRDMTMNRDVFKTR